ncbi:MULTISPECIES: hypothetical protein [unclassified Leifsonia]|uniref:hypothetical protein n=1 Tax=unclassified Leifsonia TaxID=2663824 RepID=UPI0009E8DF43|nr:MULTISPECIES: hypothetical protein [unclassified Leifsonia]
MTNRDQTDDGRPQTTQPQGSTQPQTAHQQPVAQGSVPAGGPASSGSVPLEDRSTLREEVVSRERERFGGIKFGSAFFGWLTATGTAVILTALVAATGAAVGLGASDTEAASIDENEAATIGIVGAIALVVVLLISYYCGGYVAGRMARFDGVKQGLAVWLWAVAIAVVVAIVGAIAGSQYNVLANVNSFPRIPLNEGDVTFGGIITAIALALASLGGALLGGAAGMRFHRKVDRAGLGR